ncbi:hypothetical protein FOA52_005093 [Chlamydomonas sp. UWO 241]|nr:hypothetical protein FOA52_005093 [Chlamydomonas sp. UWO 241]
MATTGLSLSVAYIFQLGLAILVFFAFSSLRLKKHLRRFYAPKRFEKDAPVKPKRLPPGYFDWWWSVYSVPLDEVIAVAGLDSAMYIRILTFALEVFVYVSVWTCIVLLPINITSNVVREILNSPFPPPLPPSPPPGTPDCGSPIKSVQREVSYIDVASISNVENSSPKLWAHMISVFVVSCIVLRILHRYTYEASLLRIMYMANMPRGGPSHTVLLTNIPGMQGGTLREFARSFIGGTLFIMLPASMKTRIMDFVEGSVGKVAKAADVRQMANRLAKHEEEVDEDGPTDGPVNPESQQIQVAPRPAMRFGDIRLDVWHQAETVLAEFSDDDQEAKMKGFLLREIDYSYGPNQVSAINPVWDQRKLERLLKDYNNVKSQLEDYLDQLAYKMRRRQVIKTRRTERVLGTTMGKWGIDKYGIKAVKVDAITFWVDRLQELSRQIGVAQKVSLGKPIPSAFITFNTRATTAHVATALHHHSEGDWIFTAAPEAREVVWGNLRMRSWWAALMGVIMWSAFIVLLVVYVIPVVFVQGIINVNTLAEFSTGLSNFVTAAFVKQILESIFPTLVMVLVLLPIPFVLRIMCYLSGYVSEGAIDFGVMDRFFWFQIFVVFLYNMIAGALINQWKDILADPAALITTLSVSIPQTATFFIAYVLTAGVAKSAVRFMRIGRLFYFLAMSRFASTPRSRARMWAPEVRWYGGLVPWHTIVFFLGILYSCINPIMCPTVLISLWVTLLAEKYTSLYTYQVPYESGGRLWYKVFHQFMIGVYALNVFMIFVLNFKRFPLGFLLIIQLAITLGYHVSVVKQFSRPLTMLSVHDAAMLDQRDTEEAGVAGVTDKQLQEIKDMYLSPVFKVHPSDLDELFHEAAIMSGRIDGLSVEDIEQAIEEEGFQSADEADEDELAAAIAAQHVEVKDSTGAGQGGGGGGWFGWWSKTEEPSNPVDKLN